VKKMKRPFLISLVVLTAVLILPCLSSPVLSQEEPTYSAWSLWLGGHYTGYEDFYKKIGEFDRDEKGAMPEVKLGYSGYKGDQSWDFFGHFYDPERVSLDLSGRSKDVFSGKVSYRSFYRQRATDLLENLMAREAVDQQNTPGGKMYTYEHENPDADFGYTRHELKTDFQVKVPGSANLILKAFHRSILEKGDDQKVVSMHCSSCHMVSKSAQVDRRTHTISAGAEGTTGPVLLSYLGSYRTFKSEAPVPEAFYDTAQHPVNGSLIEEFGSRTIFNGEEVQFGQIPETEKMAHTVKVKADLGKNGDILGSFTNSQAKNKSAGLEVTGNSGSLKYAVSPTPKTKIIASASLAMIESDEAEVDLPLWRDGLTGGGQDFSWTRYSNLSRTVAKGSAEFIYQPDRKYRLSFSAGYEGTERDDYPYFEAKGKTTKLKASAGGKYRPNSKFWGRIKYSFENIDDPFSPYEQMFERAGTGVLEKLPDNNWYYYFQRDDLRYGSVTNQPSNLHAVELNLSFRPDHKATLSAGLKASLGTNPDTDSLDFERTQLQPQVSANFAPTPMWNLFGSLSYMYDKSNGLAAVAMMDG
jgi:hypothetical protein